MKARIVTVTLLVVLALGGGLLWRNAVAPSHDPTVRRIAYYQDSMHPWVKADQPGKCPICGMDLTPVYEGDKCVELAPDMVVLTPNNVTVLGVQTDEVRPRTICRRMRVAGTLEPNEAKRTVISAPSSGRIEETDVNYAGVEVHEGERLLLFYSPELTQQKFRYLFRAQRAHEQRDPTGGIALQQGDADPYYNELISPLAGTVIERNVSRGQYVSEGEKLFTIADASVLWFRFDVYEQQLPWIRMGQKVMVTLPALPGKVFEAVITFIDPLLDLTTRSVKVRADIANPLLDLDGTKLRLLKFGMYAEGDVCAEVTDALAVPRAAVLYPGKAAYVYIDKSDGLYERRMVKLGRQGDDLWEIRDGVQAGERVVTSGNVLLDAQTQFSRSEGTSEREETAQNEASATVGTFPEVVAMPAEAAVQAGPAEGAPKERAAAAAADTKKRLTALYKSRSAGGGPTAAASVLNLNGGRGRRPASAPDPIPTGGRRLLSNDIFIRMAELRNSEMAEVAAAKEKAAETVPVADPPAKTPMAVSPEAPSDVGPASDPPAGGGDGQAWTQTLREKKVEAITKDHAKPAAPGKVVTHRPEARAYAAVPPAASIMPEPEAPAATSAPAAQAADKRSAGDDGHDSQAVTEPPDEAQRP